MCVRAYERLVPEIWRFINACNNNNNNNKIEVWPVSNLTFVLLSFKLVNSTTEVPFIVLAIYSLRSGTLKRVNGDATRTVCRLRKDVSEALFAIPSDTRRSFAYIFTL